MTDDSGGDRRIVGLGLLVIGIALLLLGVGNLTGVFSYRPPATVNLAIAAVMGAIARLTVAGGR